jgi:hypothetical protein
MLLSFKTNLVYFDDSLVNFNSIIQEIISIKTKSFGNKFKLPKLERESISLN